MFKKYRLNKGLTLEQVAEACNISWRNLFRIEHGSSKNATFETIIKLINVLGISDKDILKLVKDFQK